MRSPKDRVCIEKNDISSPEPGALYLSLFEPGAGQTKEELVKVRKCKEGMLHCLIWCLVIK